MKNNNNILLICAPLLIVIIYLLLNIRNTYVPIIINKDIECPIKQNIDTPIKNDVKQVINCPIKQRNTIPIQRNTIPIQRNTIPIQRNTIPVPVQRNKEIISHPVYIPMYQDFYEESLENRLSPPSIYNAPVLPFNIRTRGMPTEYQQIGILTNKDNSGDIKPLYGRQTYRGSRQWNYYSSTDSNLSIKIPVFLLKKKCTDEKGCNEIVDGSECNVGDKNNNIYIATIYSNDSYRYVPDII
jgi:hypothetical protein